MALTNGAGLCVGVSRYNDRDLAPLPDAALSAREVQKALDARLFPGATAILDPGSNGDLFLRLQKAAREAKGGTLFFYYAGHALRRGSELLLAVRDSELEGTKGCVPWSDVRDMLKREGVSTGVVILNIDEPVGAGQPQIGTDMVTVLGSVRSYDAGSGNASLRAYADAVLAVLQAPATEIEAFLTDEALDANGLHKALSKRAPAAAHASFSTAVRSAVLRDFAPPAVSMRGSALPQPSVPTPKVVEPPPAPEPAPEPPPAPAVASEPEPAPALEPALAPALAPLAPARPPARLAYALLAAAAVVAAIVYALFRS